MNVAIFTDNDFEKVNGVTTTLRALLEHAPADIRPRVYTSEWRGRETPTYLAVRSLGIGIPFYREMKMYVPRIRRFARAMTTDRIDLIHLTTPGPIGLAAVHLAARRRVPLVGSFHTDLTAYTSMLSGSPALGRAMQSYMSWLYRRCACVLAPSEATRAALALSGVPADRIAIWARGVSTERFTPARRSPALRRLWCVDERVPAFLYVGRLSREKGLHLLPTLSARLRQTGVPHHWVVVGDGPMRRELTRQLSSATFTGTLTPDQVATAMASADVFVFPSHTDTAGNVVLEAQASGLPVLVTPDGGPREHMADGRTGFVCNSVADFSRRLAELAGDAEWRATVSAAARQYAESRTWTQALAPLFGAYRDVGGQAQACLTRPAGSAMPSPVA